MNKKRLMLMLALMSTVAAYGAKEKKPAINLDKTVVYSTTGFATDMRKVAATPTIITAEQIEEKNYKNVLEVLEDIPAISVQRSGFGEIIDMRGQGNFGSSNRIALRNVQLLVDGVASNYLETSHAPTPINTISVDAIERIEIIPGGGSVVYGSGTQGGVINIITKKGHGTRGTFGYQRSSYEGNKYDVQAGHSIGDFDVDVVYSKSDANGYRDLEENKAEYVQGKVRYNISDKQNIEFKASRNESTDIDGSFMMTKKQMEEDRRQGSKDQLSKMKTTKDDYQLTYNAKLADNLELNVVGFHSQTSMKNGFKDPSSFDDKKKGIKPKVKYSYGEGEHAGSSVIVGVDYVDNDGYRSSYGGSSFKKESLGVFAMNNLKWGDFEFNQGIRYEKTDYDMHKIGPKKKLDKGTNEDNFAAELSGSYFYSETGKVYARVENGFTTPPTPLLSDTIPIDKYGYHPYLGKYQLTKYELNDLKSEKYNSIELGASDYIFGNTLATASVFYTRTNDEIHTVMDHGFPMKVTNFNIDKTERYGAEFALEHHLGKLTLSESYQYLQAKIKKGTEKTYNNDGERINGSVIDNKHLAGVPDHKLKLGAKYDFTDKFSVNGDVIYTGKSYIENTNEAGKTDGYTVVNIRAGYTFDNGVHLYAGINNLLDNKYEDATDYKGGEYTYSPAAERNYYAGFRYTF